MDIEPIAYFHSPYGSKFAVPRQSGLAPSVRGEIRFAGSFRVKEALRGLDGFKYIWLIWGFSQNRPSSQKGTGWSPTVRPPRLGGNAAMGVWATRSPFRPNPLGLSSVQIDRVDPDSMTIHTLGADLCDGTPIYDIKPYLEYADCHPGAGDGFAGGEWETLEVCLPADVSAKMIAAGFTEDDVDGIRESLSLDPRPHYQDDPSKTYGFLYKGRDVRFIVEDKICRITDLI